MKNNPFIIRSDVLPPHFTGREKELNELKKTYESTKHGVPSHIILYGPKGIGKSSLLLKFQEEVSNFDDVYTVRIPLSEGNFEDIYSLIVEKCSHILNVTQSYFLEKITSSGINVALGDDRFLSREIPKSSPSFAIEKILDVIYSELKSKNPVLILLFDNLEKIMNNEAMRVLSILQTALVELNLDGKNIMFVATMSEDTFYTIPDVLDSAVRTFEPYLINPLSYEEVCDAISVPCEKLNVSFDEDVLKRIYELSNGIPYYMQILAYFCLEQVNESNSVTINELKNV